MAKLKHWLFVIAVVGLFGNTVENNNKSCLDRNVYRKDVFYKIDTNKIISKRGARVDPTFKGNPKLPADIWHQKFNGKSVQFDQTPSLVNLLYMIADKYLSSCIPIILYDKYVENQDALFLEELFRHFPLSYIQGKINKNSTLADPKILTPADGKCRSYVLFLADVMRTADVIGSQSTNKVIAVARSSQWRVHEFLSDKTSRGFVNLLVIGRGFSRDDGSTESPYVMYTHSLFADGLGSSRPQVLTSWIHGHLARPGVNLFPEKLVDGFAGHRFMIVAANQPPFVFRRQILDSNSQQSVQWDGMEYRLLKLIGTMLNFTSEIREPYDISVGPGNAVAKEVMTQRADFGIGGIYVSNDRLSEMDMSSAHTQDCAAFVSLSSTALPRYRAIMGPFHWSVWLALTFIYLLGVFPLAFSDRHTLRHLLKDPGEMENMFWYMFGTFTNSFTFTGTSSWSNSDKITTRMMIGSYWLFSIIITACYTGSIIAFVTLPVFPETVDTVEELIGGYFRVGTLDRGGWQKWFMNSSDPNTIRLLKHVEFVDSIEAGLRNTTRAFFWPYAFLGSRAQLEYIVQSNFSDENANKRSALHISEECFVPFGVSIAFPRNAVYATKVNNAILRAQQSGFIQKIMNEVRWELQRTSTGKLLQASSGRTLKPTSPEERGLTLADTEGMFLLLGAGFLIAAASLASEIMGGCTRKCRKPKSRASSSLSTIDSKSIIAPTPKKRTTTKTEYDHVNNDSSVSNLSEDETSNGVFRRHKRRLSSFIIGRNDRMGATPCRRYSFSNSDERSASDFIASEQRASLGSSDVEIHVELARACDINEYDEIPEQNDETSLALIENKPDIAKEWRKDIEEYFGERVTDGFEENLTKPIEEVLP